MSLIPFSTMPDDARLWVFSAAQPLSAQSATRLLEVVDDYLQRWHAHGTPLSAARDLRDNRFLAIAVDQSTAGASGCSIDGLFRQLATMENELGTSLVGAGRVYWRASDGSIRSGTRNEFKSAARTGEVTTSTTVFDPGITDVAAWRNSFERPAAESWHARLMAA